MPADYEQFADILASKDVALKGVNKGYIALPDNSKLKLLSTGIGVLASDALGEKLTLKGFKSKACIEKGTPFRFDIKTESDCNTMYEVLSDLYKIQTPKQEEN